MASDTSTATTSSTVISSIPSASSSAVTVRLPASPRLSCIMTLSVAAIRRLPGRSVLASFNRASNAVAVAICTHARTTFTPFRYSEAPYDGHQSRGHQRFGQVLKSFDMGRGLIVPVGRPRNIASCVWLAGRDPDLGDDAKRAIEITSLFAASKAYALSGPFHIGANNTKLTRREREVLQWISAGKTSWETSMILSVSERAIDKIIAGAMTKLNAATRTQAGVNAIRLGEVEF